MTPKRGDIWVTAGGGGWIASKPRPALIIRSDLFDGLNHITFAAITSYAAHSPTRVKISTQAGYGLERESFVATDLIYTVPLRNLGRKVGQVSNSTMAKVEQSLLLYLGIGNRREASQD